MAKKGKLKDRLAGLEKEIKARGVHLAYERLKFAGLILKSGMCWFKGEYYLFVDRLLPPAARVEMLEAALEELDELAASGQLDNPQGEASETPEPAEENQASEGEGAEPAPAGESAKEAESGV